MQTVNIDPAPTPFEREMASYRANVAAEGQAAVAAIAAELGEGADAYAYWVITDKLGIVPPVKIPTCRREGQHGWQPSAPNPEERLVNSPQGFTDAAGVRHEPFRYIVAIQVFTEYHPQSAEIMAAARVKREAKRLAELKDEFALFPELVDVVTARPAGADAVSAISTAQ